MKKLEIGDSYKHIGFTLTVTAREKDIVFAENPVYGFEGWVIVGDEDVESDGLVGIKIVPGGKYAAMRTKTPPSGIIGARVRPVRPNTIPIKIYGRDRDLFP